MTSRKTPLLLAAAFAVSLGAGVIAAPARAAGDEQASIEHSLGTLQDLRRDKEFGNARDLLHRARARADRPPYLQGGLLRRR